MTTNFTITAPRRTGLIWRSECSCGDTFTGVRFGQVHTQAIEHASMHRWIDDSANIDNQAEFA